MTNKPKQVEDKNYSTITVVKHHGFEKGMKIDLQSRDYRWHVRLWYFITFRQTPDLHKMFIIESVSYTTLTIGELSCD